jgi:hypothetical protein
MWLRRSLLALIAGFLLLAVSIVAYGAHVRRSARALIRAAGQIHSTADAKQQVTLWAGGPAKTGRPTFRAFRNVGFRALKVAATFKPISWIFPT